MKVLRLSGCGTKRRGTYRVASSLKPTQIYTTMDNYKVEWHKWKDPLKQALYHKKKELAEEFGDNESSSSFQDLNNYQGQVLYSPELGAIPINETNLPSSIFNFWKGYTNFVLTDAHKVALDKCLGIETLDILTPYRFRIAIAKLFNEQDTLNRAKEALIQVSSKLKPTSNQFSALEKQYKFFAIVSHDGARRVFHGNSALEVKGQVAKYIVDYPNATIYESWNQNNK